MKSEHSTPQPQLRCLEQHEDVHSGKSIYDNVLLDSEIEKDPSLGREVVFYDNKIALIIMRSPIQRAFIGKKVYFFAKTMEIAEKTNAGTKLLEGTQLIKENIVLH